MGKPARRFWVKGRRGTETRYVNAKGNLTEKFDQAVRMTQVEATKACAILTKDKKWGSYTWRYYEGDGTGLDTLRDMLTLG